MTMELFIKFARKIEGSGNIINSSANVSEKSNVLLASLLHMNETFYDQETFDELARINFITPFIMDANTSAIYPQFKSNGLVCFEGSVLQTSKHISWTTVSILPDEANPFLQNQQLADKIIDKLHICKAPSVKQLIQHCVNVGESLSVKLKTLTTLSYSPLSVIMASIYEALEGHNKTGILTTDFVRPLEMVPIVYFHESKSIHMAKRVVTSCRDEEEIQPYLNRCPSDLARYHSVFLKLGAKKEPTAEVYADVLNDVTCNCGAAKHLLPKESSDVKKAMELFFKYLIQENKEVKIQENKLYLLSKDETLEAAQKLIFGNNKYFEKQLAKVPTDHVKLVFPIEKLPACKLKVEDCVDSIQQLPQKCRPHLLSDLIRERVILSNIVNKDVKASNELDNFVHSRYFVEGYLRLIRHVYRSNNKCWNEEEEKRLAACVQNVGFQHASGIETTLSLACITDGEVGNEIPIENTKETKSVHLEVNRDTNTVCIYFDTSDQKWFSDLTKQFTVYLNSLVSKCLKDEALIILMEIIGMKDSPKRINDFLSKEKIEEYTTNVEINEGPIYPVPGTFVPVYLHDYLDNKCGKIYEYEYKFIAFEVEDPAFRCDIDETEIEESPTYIFVHIIRQLEQTCELPLFQEYEINDGTETTKIVKAYQLFTFVRKSGSDTSNQKELVVFTGGNVAHDTLSFKEAKREIRKYLIEAWKKPEIERRRVVKRLLLKWHPDKNPDSVEFCTKVFQYIQQCLIRLENGQDLIDDDSDADKGPSDNYSSSQNWSSTWYWRYWKRRNRGWRNHTRSDRSFNDFDSWWSFRRTDTAEEEEEPYHWYSEARRWMRQAESDIRNAEISLKEESDHSFNWICYKAHQGAEKSLKAAWYAENANKIQRVKYSHDLTRIASGLHTDITVLANRLSYEAGDHSRMRYPDMFSGQQIPAEAYTREKALKVIKLAREIYSAVQEKHVK